MISLVIALSAFALPAHARVNPQDVPNENRRCMQCHGQSRMAELPPDQRLAMVVGPLPAADTPTRPGLFVPDQSLEPLSHRAVACVDCHADAPKLPHNADLKPVSCDSSCHTTEASGYLQGAHATAAAADNPLAPTCAACHGSHNILPKSDPDSRIHPVNIIKVCADCHQKQVGNLPDGKPAAAHVAAYLDSVHGRAVEHGLAVAATCADCHGAHKVLPSADPDSHVNRRHVAETCGQCHVGVERVYLKSVHGQELARGSDKAPVCS
ncbi:MAG: hypothetical protein IT442_16405, partial [Phycisphaeraceae bacterium]|nr:hypothetical protein [Phycisphaeraceae bacterium]